MKQKGFTRIELLVMIAVLGIIAAVVIPNSGLFDCAGNETATNETTVDNATIFERLSSEPITSLNLTELSFIVDYCKAWATRTYDEYWGILAIVYQNQIIINALTGGNHS